MRVQTDGLDHIFGSEAEVQANTVDDVIIGSSFLKMLKNDEKIQKLKSKQIKGDFLDNF